MSKISSASKINKSRVHNSYVEQNHRVTGVNAVKKVTSVDEIVNNADYSSGNFLFTTDAFYDRLDKLSKEYRRFYHSERDLEKAIEDIDRNSKKLSEYMNNLIEKYNKAIISLQRLENEIGTDNSSIIRDILLDYEDRLNDVSISIVNEKELNIDTEAFIEKVINSDDALNILFRPIRGMITKLYKSFRNIRIPINENNKTQYNQKDYNDLSDKDYAGMVMDTKS